MTLIVGIVCKDSLMIACESQTSYGARKDLDAIKTRTVKFKNNRVVVADSGDVTIANRTIDFMEEIAERTEIANESTVMDVAEKAVHRMRNHILDGFGGRASSEESWERFLAENRYFQLMIGLMIGNKPSLFTINISQAATVKHRHYALCGCGGDIADFLFKDYEFQNLSWKEGLVAAVFAVEKVKEHDHYCGGATRLITMDENRIVPMPARLMQRMLDKVEQLNNSAKERMRQEMKIIVDRISKELVAEEHDAIRELDAEFRASQEPTNCDEMQNVKAPINR